MITSEPRCSQSRHFARQDRESAGARRSCFRARRRRTDARGRAPGHSSPLASEYIARRRWPPRGSERWHREHCAIRSRPAHIWTRPTRNDVGEPGEDMIFLGSIGSCSAGDQAFRSDPGTSGRHSRRHGAPRSRFAAQVLRPPALSRISARSPACPVTSTSSNTTLFARRSSLPYGNKGRGWWCRWVTLAISFCIPRRPARSR